MKLEPDRIPAFAMVLASLLLLATPSPAKDTAYRSPEQVPGATTVSADQAKWLFDDGAVFIDVRNPRFFSRRHVPGAHHLDMKDSFNEEALNAVAAKNEPIVIYSSSVKCGRAYRASVLAVSWGYEKVHYFRGGMVDWKNLKYPLESVSE